MRLTLRTLLAYLDRTLDKESSETLHGKVMESSFASQLIKRIKVALSSPSVGAPSPVAAGPVEEANVISEYLDSTLPNAQVAEIERACLESDPLLAEAAGCHQILTLVLGKPAEVSSVLRERIYDLPNSDAFKSIAAKNAPPTLASGNFASLAIPGNATLGLGSTKLQTDAGENGVPTNGFGATQATADATNSVETGGVLTPPRKPPMRPVGPSDSGVSDAPTRLRNAGLADDQSKGRDANGKAIAGHRPRKTGLSDLYDGGIRTSRITPWLVSLALAGVLLFALSQLFDPLINPKTAQLDNDKIDTLDGLDSDTKEPLSASQLADSSESNVEMLEIEVPAEEAPPMTDVGSPAVATTEAISDVDPDETSTLPPPVTSEADSTASADASVTQSMPAVTEEEEPAGPQSMTPANTSDTSVAEDISSVAPMVESVAPETVPTVSIAAADASDVAEPVMPDEPKTADTAPPATAEVPTNTVAKLLTGQTLVTARTQGNAWQVVAQDGAIPANTELVCAPTFRARMEGEDGLDLTIAGPTQLGFVQKESEKTLYLASGRILVRHKTPGTEIGVSLSGRPISIKVKSADTLVAIKLEHNREPGRDPLAEASRVRWASLLVVQGAAEVTIADKASELDTGQQLEIAGDTEPVQSVAKEIEEWIDEPDPNDMSLESLARSGLIALINDTQPLELSLQEAIPFRRAEVGSLAGRTLLWIGRGDIYFGGDGILNQPRQKAYWKEHYQSLLKVVNQSARSADQLKTAIFQMEAADGAQLFQLLTGYSQEQLKGGADAKLVELLDSPSMAVRVLALENLSEITGTTLNYRADQDNAIRRAADMKKWEARARKGDIRWAEKVDVEATPASSP